MQGVAGWSVEEEEEEEEDIEKRGELLNLFSVIYVFS